MRVGCFLAALATSTFSVLAHAQGDGGQTVSADSAAKLSDEALAYVRKGAFAEARELYQRAYEISPTAPILFNLALAELNSKRALDALLHFRAYVKDGGADPAKVGIAARELLPRAFAATGHLDVRSAPAESSFSVDGAAATAGAGILDVEPGEHDIVAKTGSATVEAHAQVRAGDTTVVVFPPPIAAPEYVAPQKTPTPLELSLVTSERDVPAAPRPMPRSSARLPVSLSIAGAGAASVIGGVVFFALNQSANSRWQTLHTSLAPDACSSPSPANVGPCADLANAIHETNTDANVSTALYVAGGVLIAGALATYLLWPRPTDARAARLTPIADPLTRSVGVTGTF